MTTTTNDLSYEPTTEDIAAYNEDRAKQDAVLAERAEIAKAKANGTWGILHCSDGTLHYWRELTTGERIGCGELASQLELDRARKCFKCGAWK